MKKLILLALPVVLLCSCSKNRFNDLELKEINGFEMIETGLLKSTAALNLVLYNPNNVKAILKNADGEIFIDGKMLGRLIVADAVNINKNASFSIPAVLNLDMINTVKNIAVLARQKEVEVEINGTALVKKAGVNFSVPIKYKKKQSIEDIRLLLNSKMSGTQELLKL